MKKLPRRLTPADLSSDEAIDELFSQLEQFEPPADFVGRVMDAVSHLPLPQHLPDTSWSLPDDDEGPIIHLEHLQPS